MATPADGENLGGHGRGEAKGDHALNEAAAIHAPVFHFVDHGTQFGIQHGSLFRFAPCHGAPRGCAGMSLWQMA